MFTVIFWRNVAERAVKTAAQSAVLAVGAGFADVLTLDWPVLLGAAGGGALLSVLTSLGTELSPVGNEGTASLTTAVEPVGKHSAP